MFSEKKITTPWKDLFTNSFSFKDEDLEAEYRRTKELYQKRIFLLVLTFIIVISQVIWLLSKSINQGPDIAFNCLKPFLIVIFCFASKRWPGKIEFIIVIILLPLELGIILNTLDISHNGLLPGNFYTNGIAHEFFCLSGLLLKLSFFKQTFVLCCLTTTMSLKFIIEETEARNILILLGNFIVLSIYAFVIEKSERRYFIELKRSENSNIFFENFIKKSLPLGVIVVEKNEIAFNNRECARILKIESNRKLKMEDLNSIILENKIANTNQSLPELLALMFKGIIENVSYNFNNINKQYLRNNEREFTKFDGFLKQKEKKANKHLINIKINKMIWNEGIGIIVLLAEDPDAFKQESSKQYEQYKTCVLASVSHQFRTPLNGIIGMLEDISDNVGDKQARENLQSAMRSSERLLLLINNIMDLGQINMGNFKLDLREFNLEDVLKEVAINSETDAKKKGIIFSLKNKTQATYNKNQYIFFNDPTRLKQILFNFLTNSLKHTTSGFISLSYEVKTSIETNRPQRAYFTIEDSGSGIKPEMIQILFKVLGNLELEEMKELNTHGMGFGLAISHKLLEYMNKEIDSNTRLIDIKSAVGKGSLFEFYLENFHLEFPSIDLPSKSETYERGFTEESLVPAFKLHSLEKANTSKLSLETDAILLKKKKVLVVDDDPVNILVISRFLEFMNKFEYICVDDGLKALNTIKSFAGENKFFDLVLMDCNMPVLDGYTATVEIVDMINKGAILPVPIIGVTANVLEADLNRCLECGMIDYITKPLKRDKFKRTIDKYIF